MGKAVFGIPEYFKFQFGLFTSLARLVAVWLKRRSSFAPKPQNDDVDADDYATRFLANECERLTKAHSAQNLATEYEIHESQHEARKGARLHPA